jgi:hypothetical protein
MPSPTFANLQLALERAGVSPFYVQRTLLELGEHFEDLESDALAAGLSRNEAEALARAMLGNEQTIASVILAHPELRTWSHRWPRAALCLRVAVVVATLPEAPVTFCIDRSPVIARWGSAAGLAMLLVGSLLAYLNSLIVLG